MCIELFKYYILITGASFLVVSCNELHVSLVPLQTTGVRGIVSNKPCCQLEVKGTHSFIMFNRIHTMPTQPLTRYTSQTHSVIALMTRGYTVITTRDLILGRQYT